MWGALAGDIIGSVFEGWPGGSADFELWSEGSRFTDDSVLSIAVADAILEGEAFSDSLVKWYRRHPGRGYGGWFAAWAEAGGGPAYGSFGNGGAMRVAPAAWAARSEQDALELARESATTTHDHPDGIAGAEAVALAVYMARADADPTEILARVSYHAGYDPDVPLESLTEVYALDARAAESVPVAIRCALDASSAEEAIRSAIALGGDSDTIACMTGAIAEARFDGLPAAMAAEVRRRLAPDLLDVVDRFTARYGVPTKA